MRPVARVAAALALLLSLPVAIAVAGPRPATSDDARPVLSMRDVFELEWASDPQISPDGTRIVYVRNFNDVMSDRARSNLWLIDLATGEQRPLTSGANNNSSPRFSPDGTRLAWVSTQEGGAQIWVRWMDTGQAAAITHLTRSPGALTWSPDGRWLSFSMFVPAERKGIGANVPKPPRGAQWAAAPRVITKLQYRADGAGYLPDGFNHLFLVPAEGGSPRQLTDGEFNHFAHAWAPDGEAIVLSANRHEDWQYDPADSEIYELTVATGEIRPLTSRHGPDQAPQVSPDGTHILFTGHDERYQGYQRTRLYVMARDGSGVRELLPEFDRSVQGARFSADGDSIWFQFTDHGRIAVASVSAAGGAEPTVHSDRLGGLSLGRPYAAGQFSLSRDGKAAITFSRPDRPADVAVVEGGESRVLTALNDDLLGYRSLGAMEEIWWNSSADGRRIQGWLVTPPDFDPSQKYPLLLEIHGGPFAAYGPHFAAEIQLYAAAGYVVLYANPRGSTSYGEQFGNLIHHAYPGQDFDDLMSGVDAVIARGFVDPERLFVTGGSGGGVLTAWIVGHTDRFAAAVSQKPVINWYSFVLTADSTPFFYKYWFPGLPWEHTEHYMQRSPIQYAGNVSTPTMLITGERDYRTPISETEQFYTALQLRRVPSAMVRIPEASHGIASRPSQMLQKVAHVLAWFERYPRRGAAAEGS